MGRAFLTNWKLLLNVHRRETIKYPMITFCSSSRRSGKKKKRTVRWRTNRSRSVLAMVAVNNSFEAALKALVCAKGDVFREVSGLMIK